MGFDISIKVGGEAGQGIQTVGQLLALVCRRAGLYVMAINDFESRIRGGHSFFQMRICDQPVYAPHHRIDLLVALNDETLDLHFQELTSDGLAIIGEDRGQKREKVRVIPFNELAKQAGGRIYSNTVAAGVCLSLLEAPVELVNTVLSDHFGSRGTEIVDKNLRAAALGYKAADDILISKKIEWQLDKPRKGVLLEGSKAIALGALSGDCRFAAFYPMSPATSIIRHLVDFSDHFPLLIEQAEDEIAAANMIIGASFAGVRSITATSGGGFCLMTEALGLAGITETPIVVVNAQRPGPATGLPTRTAQGDLQFVLHAGQDEFPRFVFAPGTPFEAYEVTFRALHLSEKYQVPAIILTDQYLNDSLFTEERSFEAPDRIERFIASDADFENPDEYKRYTLLPSGISPRVLPCAGSAKAVVSGNEHREDGHISEAIKDRVNMVQKRFAKYENMADEMKPPEGYHDSAELLLIGWGSTKGAIRESVDLLRDQDIDAGAVIFTDLWPFPADQFTEMAANAKQIIPVEQNYTSQLGMLIREQTGITPSGEILKYDGRPFFPNDIAVSAKAYAR